MEKPRIIPPDEIALAQEDHSAQLERHGTQRPLSTEDEELLTELRVSVGLGSNTEPAIPPQPADESEKHS